MEYKRACFLVMKMKVSFKFWVRDGPLEKLWGAGEVQKKISCKGKLSEKNPSMQSRPGK